MTDFTLSGLPVGNAGEIPIEALAALSGGFLVGTRVTGQISAQASANMLGTVSPTVTGGNTTLLSVAANFVSSLIRFNSTIQESFHQSYAHLGGSLNASLAGSPDAFDIGALPLYATAFLTGNFITGAVVQGQINAQASANMSGSPSVNQFIGEGDSPGNGLLSAAASANMSGEPDPLKDGGSPPFVYPNGVDSYVVHPDTANSLLRGGTDFSCVVIFDPEVVNNAASGVVCGKHDPGSTEHGWKIEYDDVTGEVTVTVSSAADGSDRAERTTAVGGSGIRTRTVFAFTWDSADLELYVAGSSSQGAQLDTGTPGAMVASNAQFAIGAEDTLSTAASFYRGSVHGVYIFDDVLSSGEVATIDESGYLPTALDTDVNLQVAWRPDRIEGSSVGFALTEWLDELNSLQLDRVNAPYCFPGIFTHVRQPADEWNMDFLNVPAVLGLDQNLASNYTLSSSGTDATQNGTFRLYTPATNENEPEIVTGYRAFLTDITIIWGGRKDEASATDVVWLDYFGIRIEFDATTKDLFVFQGTSGPTRYEFGQEVPGTEGPDDGPVTVFALRYNAQTDQFTLFVNGEKLFEEGTTVTGADANNDGIRMCEAADWGSINPTEGQADRRGAVVYPSALPDILLRQAISGFFADTYGMDDLLFQRTLRAAHRRNPIPTSSLFPFGQFFFEYAAVHGEDDVPPEPRPNFRTPYHLGSGSVTLFANPVNGEQVRLQDGATSVVFEFGTLTTGDIAVVIGVNASATIDNLRTAVAASALNLTIGPTVAKVVVGVEGAYGRIIQDDLHDGDLPLIQVVVSLQDPPVLHVTGPYRVLGPQGSLGLTGQPSVNDEFMLDDGANTADFTFGMNVTIGATIKDTMDNLVTAVNASVLTITADPTVEVDYTGDGNTEAVFTLLTHAASDDPEDYSNRGGLAVVVALNVSGNLVADGLTQPAQFTEAVPQAPVPDVRSLPLAAAFFPFVDSPYVVLEPEVAGAGGGVVPPFINPNPTIISVTATTFKQVTAVANAGPTDAGDVRSWWEIEIVPGDPTFNLRIDEADNNFSLNKNQTDQFPVPLGLNFDKLRIRFVIQSQVDCDQIWYSLYVRMEGANFDNSETTVIILPGTGAPEPPPTIKLTLTAAQQAFVLEEGVVRTQRQLALSQRSRYKLTRVFINSRLDPRIDDRNIEGLEFGLLSTLEDFENLGTEVRTATVAAGDVGFLDALAYRFYGPGFEDFWWAIASANNIIDPELDMFVGQRLVIPPRDRITAFLGRKPRTLGR
jgi:hypothetical protein